MTGFTSKRKAATDKQKQVTYTGNGSAGRENMTAPTGFFFQMPKAEQEPRREWVGLTDEEIKDLHTKWNDEVLWDNWNYERAIEAKLKEKNA